MHDPARTEQRRAMQSAGAHAAADSKRRARAADPKDVPPAPKTLDDAVKWSSWAMRAVATGDLDARTGHEIGYLVNSFKAAVEKRELVNEVEALRKKVAELHRTRSA